MNKRKIILSFAFVQLGVIPMAYAGSGEEMKPNTCYLSSLGNTGQVACLNEKGEPSELQAVTVQSDEKMDLRISIGEVQKTEEVYGAYALTVFDDPNGPSREVVINILPAKEKSSEVSENATFEELISPVVYRGGRGGYRGGAYRGGAVYRGGAYRGAAVVRRGVAVGVGAAAAGAYYGGGEAYCGYAPYPPCGGGAYYGGGGYYGGGAAVVRGGAVVRRGGAVAYRGGAYRGGGARVSHHGGGRRR